MPEEVEVETKELQETIQELHEERKEREEEEKKSAWTRYIALTTAILAVFAAIGALLSGGLVNEAMMDQLKASDTWNEYQAARQKDYLLTLEANALIDRGARPSAPAPNGGPAAEAASSKSRAGHERSVGKSSHAAAAREWKPLSPDARAEEYVTRAQREADKEADLQKKATGLEKEAEHLNHAHHSFAYSVALIQVAIALSAVAALLKMKAVWGISILAGLAGIVLFGLGLVTMPRSHSEHAAPGQEPERHARLSVPGCTASPWCATGTEIGQRV